MIRTIPGELAVVAFDGQGIRELTILYVPLNRNWSKWKRIFVGFLISLLTFSVYIGSAIYTSAIPSLMADFGVSLTVATLGLTLFVFAYGIGPSEYCKVVMLFT